MWCPIIVIAIAIATLNLLLNPIQNQVITINDIEKYKANWHIVKHLITKSLFPRHLYNGYNDPIYCSLQEDFDSRLIVALWIKYIQQSISNDSIDASFKLPFSWQYLVANETLDGPLERFSTCNRDEVSSNHIPVNCLLSQYERRIEGNNYVMNHAPVPERIVFLGIGPHGSSLRFPTNAVNEVELTRFIETTVEGSNFAKGISLTEEIEELMKVWPIDPPFTSNEKDSESMVVDFKTDNKILHLEDFKLNVSLIMNSLANITAKDRQFLTTFKANHANPNQTKYFHEADVEGSSLGNHYDWRFFAKLEYSEYERKAVLHRLTRAWLRFANSIGLKTWLAHGSLLGWYWNGMNLPWDEDLDVQMTANSLFYLARYYNQSIVVDLTKDSEILNMGIGKYLVDVSPNFAYRKKGNGNNTIDARFIDIATGFYVDITALALTDACNDIDFEENDEFNQVLDEYFIEKKDSLTISNDDIKREWNVARQSHLQKQDIFNCRNNHFYILDELNPLIETLFEGVTCFVPNNYKQILTREYPNGLRNYQFAGHTFLPVLRLWIRLNICKHDKLGNVCSDKETLLEANHTGELTSVHDEQKRLRFSSSRKELLPIRIDPWVLERSRNIVRLLNFKDH